MADKPVSVTIPPNAWTAITAAGESGTVWMGKLPDSGRIVIAHTDGVTTALDNEVAYQIPNIKRDEATDIVQISADNAQDIFYAFATDSGGKLNVDVS